MAEAAEVPDTHSPAAGVDGAAAVDPANKRGHPQAAVKKRGKKRFRRRRAAESEDEGEEAGAGAGVGAGAAKAAGPSSAPAADPEIIELLKEEQRARRRRAGVGARSLATVKRNKAEQLAAEAAAVTLQDAKKEDVSAKVAKVDGLLGGSFAATKADVHEQVTKKQMEEYINSKMSKAKDGDDAAGDDDELLGPDELAELHPADAVLNQPLEPFVEPIVDPQQAADTDALPFNSGLAEVALPMAYRIKNMEDTERARREAVSSKQAWERAGRVSGSFTANYNSHRREHAMMLKGIDPDKRNNGPGMGMDSGMRVSAAASSSRPTGAGAGAGAVAPGDGAKPAPRFEGRGRHYPKQASDDAAVGRFRKHAFKRR